MNHRRAILATMWIITSLAAIGMGATVWVVHSNQAPAVGGPAAFLGTGDGQSTGALPVLFDAAAFSLTDQDAHTFSSDQLRGKVWVADFIFTNCSSLCPLMTQQMHAFQQATAGSDIQMVSFSVDPQRDTPAVFKQYAQTNHADETRWHFLTGTKEQTWDVSKAMKLAVGPDRGDQVNHSSHFLLVDAAGKVRGIYDLDAGGSVPRLISDAQRLARGEH